MGTTEIHIGVPVVDLTKHLIDYNEELHLAIYGQSRFHQLSTTVTVLGPRLYAFEERLVIPEVDVEYSEQRIKQFSYSGSPSNLQITHSREVTSFIVADMNGAVPVAVVWETELGETKVDKHQLLARLLHASMKKTNANSKLPILMALQSAATEALDLYSNAGAQTQQISVVELLAAMAGAIRADIQARPYLYSTGRQDNWLVL